MRATKLLCCQHAHLVVLVERLASHPERRIAGILDLVEELTAHVAIESYFFYSAVRERAELDLEEFHRRHAMLKSALTQLVHAEADDAAFAARVQYMRAALADHIAADESLLLPRAEARVPAHELEILGLRMESFYDDVSGGRKARYSAPS